MAQQGDVNVTRRLLTVLGGALPLAGGASLMAAPTAAISAEPVGKAGKSAAAGKSTDTAQLLPPANLPMHPAYAQVIAAWPMCGDGPWSTC